MKIGIPKEIKNSEFRVSLTAKQARVLVKKGHEVFVEKEAGVGSGIEDKEYEEAGAQILSSIEDVYKKSEMILKVKEPLKKEFPLFKENQILFTFLHMAAEKDLAKCLLSKKVTALAYETIEDEKGELPLLKPMSQVAGRLGLQNGVYYLQKFLGGKGILAGGVAGARKSKITILGGGEAGFHAAKMAVGLEADVTILDISKERLKELETLFSKKVNCLLSNKESLSKILKTTDLLIGSVLLKGHKAPKIVSKEMIKSMEKGSVVVDISIDQGGCFETTKATSHENPTYKEFDVIHYCVPNIPSATSVTSTEALTSATFPYVEKLANKGLKAIKESEGFKKSLNSYQGQITYAPVAEALNYPLSKFPKI